MADETESLEEMLALQEKIHRLTECGWSHDPDDQYALRLMWYAGRDYERATMLQPRGVAPSFRKHMEPRQEPLRTEPADEPPLEGETDERLTSATE